MQPLSLEQIISAINQLNLPERPFSYSVQGNKIVAEWKYLDAIWAAPLAANNVEKTFKLVVTLDELTHTYTSQDTQTSKSSGFSLLTNGTISFGGEMGGFKGHKIGKEMGFGLGHAKQPQSSVSIGGMTYSYSFDTSEIKKPLFELLEKSGWTKKKNGFLGGLFGR